MALVFTGSLKSFQENLSHIPDLLAGGEHPDSYRTSPQYRAWSNSVLYLSRDFLVAGL